MLSQAPPPAQDQAVKLAYSILNHRLPYAIPGTDTFERTVREMIHDAHSALAGHGIGDIAEACVLCAGDSA